MSRVILLVNLVHYIEAGKTTYDFDLRKLLSAQPTAVQTPNRGCAKLTLNGWKLTIEYDEVDAVEDVVNHLTLDFAYDDVVIASR